MANVSLDILTYSSATTYCLCERKYFWRFERAVRPKREEESDALVVGSVSHVGCDAYVSGGLQAGLDAIADWMKAQNVIGDAVRKAQERAAKARAMVRVAALKWGVEATAPMSEMKVETPLVNPETGRSSRTFRYMGKVDGVDGGRLFDWKFIGDVAKFVKSKVIGYQTEIYAAALASYGIHIDSAEYRLVEKPTIKFCGKDKDAGAYEERCYNWLLDDPSHTVTHEVWLNPQRIEMARRWLWDVGQRIADSRKRGAWLTNELACHTWNRQCEYMGLCEIEANGGDPEDLIVTDYADAEKHPELLG